MAGEVSGSLYTDPSTIVWAAAARSKESCNDEESAHCLVVLHVPRVGNAAPRGCRFAVIH